VTIYKIGQSAAKIYVKQKMNILMKMKMKVLIYKCIAPNGKLYIGQVLYTKGIKVRWRQHVTQAIRNPTVGSRLLNRAINKYNPEEFKIEQIACVSHKIKDITEMFCIAYYNSLVPNGYNLQSGGTFTTHSSETKLLRSKSLKKLLESPEKRQIWSKAKLGVSQGIKNNRKFDEDKNLPKYIRRIRGKYEGYAVDSHPKCKCKKFTSIKLSMDEKLSLAVSFLRSLI
jgi:hypothetical protein